MSLSFINKPKTVYKEMKTPARPRSNGSCKDFYSVWLVTRLQASGGSRPATHHTALDSAPLKLVCSLAAGPITSQSS